MLKGTPQMSTRGVNLKLQQKNEAIIKSCTEGINGMLNDPIIKLADVLLDEIATEMFDADYKHPLHYMRNQVLRSTGSIAANLAEAIGRGQAVDKRFKLLIARGEAYESTIWLRALNKTKQYAICLEICAQLDARIIELTNEIIAINNQDETPVTVFDTTELKNGRQFGETIDEFKQRIAKAMP